MVGFKPKVITLGYNFYITPDISFFFILIIIKMDILWLTYVNTPLDQFDIVSYISLDAPIIHLCLTNISFYLISGALISIIFHLLSTNYNIVAPNRWSISQESLYSTIHSITTNQINNKNGQIYFPFIYTLFIFILANNLIGMVPYSFASTSHFVLTFSLSFSVVLVATILGFQKHGLTFFSLLVPAGCPLGLLPLLVLIEFIIKIRQL